MNDLSEKQKNLNIELTQILEQEDLKSINITMIGNPTLFRSYNPLLVKDNSLKIQLNKKGIILNEYNFCRIKGNNEYINLSLLAGNASSIEINEENIEELKKIYNGCSIENYYSDINQEIGLSDAIFLDNSMVIYRPTLSKRSSQNLNQDLSNIETILRKIEYNNKYNDCNNQVYICGIREYNCITRAINIKLKKLISKYPNVIYVSPLKSNMFNKISYLKLYNHILKVICKNYTITRINIENNKNEKNLQKKL